MVLIMALLYSIWCVDGVSNVTEFLYLGSWSIAVAITQNKLHNSTAVEAYHSLTITSLARIKACSCPNAH